jgi:hypothetical protein
MRPLFGPRTVVEAAFLVAVPVIALEVGLSWPAIIGAGAIAYLLVLAVEGAIWREGKRAGEPAPALEPAPAPAVVAAAEPASSPKPLATDHVRVLRPEPEPELVAVALVPEPPKLAPVPDPDPVPEPPAPEPEPELPPAATITHISGARQWNVWDLEQLAREHAGGDAIADEERTFLLMYLRDFAGPDGLLPVDFDDLVRQSFGGLVANQ